MTVYVNPTKVSTNWSGPVTTPESLLEIVDKEVPKKVALPEQFKIIPYTAGNSQGSSWVYSSRTAVEIIHLPTGTVTKSDGGRSAHQNKIFAMATMRHKLEELGWVVGEE